MIAADVYPKWVSDASPIDDPYGRGERAAKFFGALRHPKSVAPKRAYELPPFWERIIKRIYGPASADGSRLVRTVYIQIPRGARKTTIGAGLGLLHTCGHERTEGGSCILAAGAEDQAQLAFDEAQAFIKATRPLQAATRTVKSQLQIEHVSSGSILRAIPADGDVQHGKTPYMVLVDELHIWRNRRLWRALKTGLLKIPNTLLVVITTAGRGQDNLAYEEYSYAKRIAAGEIENPAYLPIIFEPPNKYDWRDEKVWHRVNPGLVAGFPDLVGMRQAAIEAKEKPADQEDFKNYNLNEWLDSSTSPFVSMEVYDQCGGEPVDLEALKGEPCWLGVDLSSTTDLTAVVAAWRVGDDEYVLHAWPFCPERNLRERADKTGAPYVQWAKDGLIEATPGNVVDYRAVERRIRELFDTFNVQEIAFDPALAQVIMNSLLDDGLPVVEHRQGSISMMPSIAALERAIVGRRLRHGDHPILRFCFANAEIERNKQGHAVRFHKPKRWLSIDLAVAAAMAVGRASVGETGKSIYDDVEARPDGFMVW